MPEASSIHKVLVMIPSYNTGAELLGKTVGQALGQWPDVWVIIDGSNDGSEKSVEPLSGEHPGLRVITLPKNSGKGSAICHGIDEAARSGFTHVLTMDADGQHFATQIPDFISRSMAHPNAMILGQPVFDDLAPALRVQGRKISNWWTGLETLWCGIGDSLFGFRLYPIAPLQRVFRSTRYARRFDFDTEVVVRMAWLGVPSVPLPSPVRYLNKEEGGVSQFRYFRDNSLLSWMHFRLFFGFVFRLPLLLFRRLGKCGKKLA